MIYSAAKVVLIDPMIKDKFLLIYREVNGSSGYEAAGGRLEVDFDSRTAETFEQCAIREIKEEVGVDCKVIDYLGSYSFFWSIIENNCSNCVVFLGEITGGAIHNTNVDQLEYDLEPRWVTILDIINDNIPIRDNHTGLKPILLKAAKCYA